MGFRELIESFRGKNEERKSMIKGISEQRRIEKILDEREKSANQRELERYLKEKREKEIKLNLDMVRKEREQEANFGHQPLGAENIISKKSPQILKTKNLFKGSGSMFNQPQTSITGNNKNMFKTNEKLLKGRVKF